MLHGCCHCPIMLPCIIMSSSSDICSPEQRQRVHKLAQHGGEAGQLEEDGRLDGQPLLRFSEATGSQSVKGHGMPSSLTSAKVL